MKTLKTLNGLHISGRRWFQRTYGNTYHTVTIYANGETLTVLPKQYGYGDQYLESALEWLESHGYIERERYPNGGREGGTRYVRESLGGTYSVVDVPREKDL